ncbi:hypothetical protein [Yeguia hominis]|uniref:Uncharacterized protein n=1 Tax=Yeguia hominis TaxID=2763662 RepID=A0A926D8S6_9FIRM|nr:hypothetical protein [Yeguia hominis]MBC8533888.1 hypothetical protein [Yeguia hominis]
MLPAKWAAFKMRRFQNTPLTKQTTGNPAEKSSAEICDRDWRCTAKRESLCSRIRTPMCISQYGKKCSKTSLRKPLKTFRSLYTERQTEAAPASVALQRFLPFSPWRVVPSSPKDKN